jgi:hypothetical protein
MYSNLYGSSWIAAIFCGFKKPPFIGEELWQHGWVFGNIKIPEQVFGSFIEKKTTKCLVATQKIENYLKVAGYNNAKAIGLPYVYLPEISVERKEKTLLVMPIHSIPGSFLDTKNLKKYMEYISEISVFFNKTTVCLNAHDYKHENIRNIVSQMGLDTICGVDGGRNSLKEQYVRFKSYSHMTTNGAGSHIAYAAATGMKISISGPFSQYDEDSLSGIEFYKQFPSAIRSAVERSSKDYLESKWPWLFVSPENGIENIAWGESEIGSDCKQTPEKLQKLMGWNTRSVLFSNDRFTDKARKTYKLIINECTKKDQ